MYRVLVCASVVGLGGALLIPSRLGTYSRCSTKYATGTTNDLPMSRYEQTMSDFRTLKKTLETTATIFGFASVVHADSDVLDKPILEPPSDVFTSTDSGLQYLDTKVCRFNQIIMLKLFNSVE